MSFRGASGRASLPGIRRRVALVVTAALVCLPGAAACSDGKRPPKPSCPSGYVAEWDDDDNEWECERKDSRNGSGKGSRGGSGKDTRRR